MAFIHAMDTFGFMLLIQYARIQLQARSAQQPLTSDAQDPRRASRLVRPC
ncbi:protein of unknown function (plasmid) [Agrobacterium pusense]|uniref:Uncharacterized protein n=1 Tax=Agrobacterium pusense TaxID=648995 RepID=U4QI24_9HYPH|nr:protein of unknown function [Agrobacterium pusense]